MAERTIETNMKLTGMEEYVAGIEKMTAALKAASEAKKEFDALFGKESNSLLLDPKIIAQAIYGKWPEAQEQS